MIPYTLALALFAYGLLTMQSVLWWITITRLEKSVVFSAFGAIIASLATIGTLFSFAGLYNTLKQIAEVI